MGQILSVISWAAWDSKILSVISWGAWDNKILSVISWAAWDRQVAVSNNLLSATWDRLFVSLLNVKLTAESRIKTVRAA